MNNFPKSLTLLECELSLDGGSFELLLEDDQGGRHTLLLVQHMFTEVNDFTDELPGRLYWNKQLIEVRSGEEKQLLHMLEQLPLPNSISEARGVKDVQAYVKSDEYVQRAEAQSTLQEFGPAVKDEDPLAELMQDCPVCGGDGADGRCENCSGKGWT